ncbi:MULTISPECIES: aminoglycoside phosphotransferase family protein [Paenibacillus]|uniref:Phosphotransferase n=1 Tax=Paenibacillus xylanilyticus TaxID=248903 RepID=A0A7Y6BYL5_9BACL|nr:aminoglycoside phosphotransferase family protein [Paenibacillus xylanilyticus]NUU76535.1 phosphotransferase [Paenibacillus xylanilyticus]
MKLIGQGRTADIYAYPSNQIMKLYKSDFSFEAVQNEFRITQILYDKGLPVPQARVIIDEANRQGIVFERIEGHTMFSMMFGQPLRLQELVHQLAVCHVELHSQSDDQGVLPSQKQILSGAIRRTQLLSEEDKTRILVYLSSLPERTQICHGDYHPDNVMVNEMKDSCYVIDWMTGMSGDPAGDVARSWVILKSASLPEDADPEIRLGFERSRDTIVDGYTNHYMHLTGLTWKEIESWILPVAAARLEECLPGNEAEEVLKFVQEQLNQLNV